MKLTFIVLLVVTSTIMVYGEELTFRGHSFGTSMQSFILEEGIPDAEISLTAHSEMHNISDYSLRYTDVTVAGYNANFEASFLRNKLNTGIYSFKLIEENDTDAQIFNRFINSYRDLQRRLDSLYQEPVQEDYLEESSLPMSRLMEDVIRRDLVEKRTYDTVWEYGEGSVILTLKFVDNIITLSLSYISPELYQTQKAIAHEQATNTDGL